MDKYREINSLESIVFIWAAAAFLVFLYMVFIYFFQKIKSDIFIQIKRFNTEVFIPDRIFFEERRHKSFLTEKDLMHISRDKEFMDHLWRKEIDYYESLMRIVGSLRSLQFIQGSMVIFTVLVVAFGTFMIKNVFYK